MEWKCGPVLEQNALFLKADFNFPQEFPVTWDSAILESLGPLPISFFPLLFCSLLDLILIFLITNELRTSHLFGVPFLPAFKKVALSPAIS